MPSRLAKVVLLPISLKKDEEDIWLNITDNGIGIGSLLDLEQLNSLGLVLMQGLTEDLHGIFTINSDQRNTSGSCFFRWRLPWGLNVILRRSKLPVKSAYQGFALC